MSDARLVVNQYNDSLTGHTNLSIYAADGSLLGTWGGNVRDLDGNPWNGKEGGVYSEIGARTPSAQTTFWVSDQVAHEVNNHASLEAWATVVNNGGMYNLLNNNCVDKVQNWLELGSVSYNPETLFTQGSLLDRYSTAKYNLTGAKWANFYSHNEEWTETEYQFLDEMFADYEKGAHELGTAEDSEEVQQSAEAAAKTGYSPIAIDLNGDSLQTTSLKTKSVLFDLDGNGTKDKTAWLDASDGFLAIDLNNDGSINNGAELFGGGARGDGFAKLALFDSNGDKKINASDENFNKLLIWNDQNSDGVSTPQELKPLDYWGVSELSLNYYSYIAYDNGNVIGEHSFAVVNGVQTYMADIYFNADLNVPA